MCWHFWNDEDPSHELSFKPCWIFSLPVDLVEANIQATSVQLSMIPFQAVTLLGQLRSVKAWVQENVSFA